MRTHGIFVSLLIALGIAGCSGSNSGESAQDPAIAELNAWRVAQTEQECPDVVQDEAALALVRNAQRSGDVRNVYGEDDPYDRVTPVIDHLWTRPNPNGDGVIVTAVRDADGNTNSSTNLRYRAVWLVLDDQIYPLNTDASGAHGLLFAGLPTDVAQQSGLPSSGVDPEEDLGIEDVISFNWGGEEDPLPTCD